MNAKKLFPFLMGATSWGGLVQYYYEGKTMAAIIFAVLFIINGILFATWPNNEN